MNSLRNLITRSGHAALIVLALGVLEAHAQSWQAGAHFASARWSEFDGADSGM